MRFLVELYLPRAARGRARLQADALRAAAAALRAEGGDVRRVQTVFVPEDETCFHLLEAPDLATATRLVTGAGLHDARIRDAV